MASWRLIESSPDDGHRNMGLDEALLESCLEGGAGFPCLRFYSFKPACLSLGAYQPWEGSCDPEFCKEKGIEIVRRPTGGRVVLHHRELTYAVVARLGDGAFTHRVRCNYDAISRALVTAFGSLGVTASVGAGRIAPSPREMEAACFSGPTDHEISSGPWKLAGSAQVRRRGAFLQHGSLPLVIDAGLLEGAISGGSDSPDEPRDLRGLSQVAGREVAPEELAAAIITGFRGELGAEFASSGPTAGEQVRAEQLRGHKYLTTAWTLRR